MPSESKEAATRNFVMRTLPRAVGAGGLLVYLLTLNHWISFYSLGTVMRVSGWSWQPQLTQPLTTIVLFPFGFLPALWIPAALNFFTAVCAALVLALLARTVALFPHDLMPPDLRPKDRPAAALSTSSAWMPPVLAAMICGLQLSFWEHATAATGEMIDLLILAYVIRCLLEFRVSRDPSWLWRSALVYGAGMANNWAMPALLPLYLAALARIKGLSFLNRRFLLRIALGLLAGLSTCLILPALHGLRPGDRVDFGSALMANLDYQAGALAILHAPSLRLWTTMSLLALFLVSIRWKSQTAARGIDSRLGILLNRSAGHFVHALLLAGSIWIALDPVASPRHLGRGAPMLTWYYIAALVAGYCSGYFLLLGSDRFRPWESKIAPAATWILFCLTPPLLLWRGLGSIRTTNGPEVHQFARDLCADLPAGRFILLSDDPARLFLARTELSAQREKEALPLETLALFSPDYQEFMAGEFRARWPAGLSTNRLEIASRTGVAKLIAAFAAREPVVYLHPSSGLFFETFTDEPNGLIRRLAARPGVAASIPLAEETIAANEHLWQQRWPALESLARYRQRHAPDASPPARPLLKLIRLADRQNSTVTTLAAAYSKTMNDWGVRLQGAERWPEAGVWFSRALELNPDNLTARINAEYNRRRRGGDTARLIASELRRELPERFDASGDWRLALETGGPVDEPTHLLRTGRMFLDGGSVQQASASFARSAELAPDWIAPKLWLAQSRIGLGDFAGALELAGRVEASGQALGGPALSQILFCRARALQQLGRTNEAVRCVENFVRDHGDHNEVLTAAATFYAINRQFEAELAVLDQLLSREPQNAGLLLKKGVTEFRLSRVEAAIATLTAALAIAPNDDDARLHRAVAYLAAGRLDEAHGDYLELLKRSQRSQSALFGLGNIAWRQRDTNAAIRFYRQFLSNSITGSPQSAIASERLDQLESARIH